MAYISLYRKWRSQRFDELVGQEHITQTLKNSLKRRRIFPVYLFCGPRGTGKTSTARILAKALNCGEGIVEEPCNNCSNCRGISSGSMMDVIEIDAASHTQVEKVREFIIEKVSYQPVSGRYKVYIIDEVHKLSGPSFDALLKTLEEPPDGVVFILATTDPQKVPATILSRCQRYDFRRIAPREILRRLRNIGASEGLILEEGALGLLSEMADGSLRDALVLLEQVTTYSGKDVSLQDIVDLLGLTNDDTLFEMARLIKERNALELLRNINELYLEGKDLAQLANDLVKHFRNLMMIKICHDAPFLSIAGEERLARCVTQAALFELADLMRILRLLMALSQELRQGYDIKILWEIHLIRLSHAQADSSLESLDMRLRLLEKKSKSGVVGESSPPREEAPRRMRRTAQEPPSPDPYPEEPPPPPVVAHDPPGSRGLPSLWHALLTAVRTERISIHSTLAGAKPMTLQENRLVLGISKQNSFDKDTLEKNRVFLEDVLGRIHGKRLPIELVIMEDGSGASAKSPDYHPMVQGLIEEFDATVIDRT